jgi:hypothetical protein
MGVSGIQDDLYWVYREEDREETTVR